MKISKRICILILLVLVISSACTNKKIQNSDKDILKEESGENSVEKLSQANEPILKTREKIQDPFLEKLSPNATSEDIALYLRENIAMVTRDEADKMFEWLLIYQDKTVDDFNSIIDEAGYIEPFEDYMGGEWDKAQIENIQDETVKKIYISLVNNFLKINNYFDYYNNVETNWDELVEYSSYLSDDLRMVVELNKKFENYEYDRYELDVIGLSKDIIAVEEIIKNSKSTFTVWKANDLYKSLLFDLLVGPENSYVYHYEGKKTKEYKALMDLKSKYPESVLKEIIDEIDLIEVEDIIDVIEIIDKKIQFGLDSDNYLEVNKIGYQNGQYSLIEIHIPSDIEKQSRINNIIKSNTQAYIENTAKDKAFNLDMEVEFQNKRYISYYGFIEITDSKGGIEYLNLYRNLDYKEEKYVTLEDYFEADFSFIQEYIEGVSGVKIESLPNFQLTDYGMLLDLGEETSSGEYIYLKHKDLLEYFTLEELLANN